MWAFAQSKGNIFPVEIDSVKLSQMELKATQTQNWNPYKLTVLINIRMSAQQSQSLPLPRALLEHKL
jgi:hypothetical protein